jgi:hypothetical protein
MQSKNNLHFDQWLLRNKRQLPKNLRIDRSHAWLISFDWPASAENGYERHIRSVILTQNWFFLKQDLNGLLEEFNYSARNAFHDSRNPGPLAA